MRTRTLENEASLTVPRDYGGQKQSWIWEIRAQMNIEKPIQWWVMTIRTLRIKTTRIYIMTFPVPRIMTIRMPRKWLYERWFSLKMSKTWGFRSSLFEWYLIFEYWKLNKVIVESHRLALRTHNQLKRRASRRFLRVFGEKSPDFSRQHSRAK